MEKMHWFRHRAVGLQVLFIVIILYAVTSFFVLGLALGILPYLHYQFYLKQNIEYAVISFVLTSAISAYHLSIMFRLKKRKTDQIENPQLAETVHWFKKRAFITQGLFILIALYVAAAIVAALCLLPGFIPLSSASLPYLCTGFSMFSFAVAALISACHLSTMIRRRKRKTDHAASAQVA
jgi:membrane protein implicated in regulation of membrane protease activity